MVYHLSMMTDKMDSGHNGEYEYGTVHDETGRYQYVRWRVWDNDAKCRLIVLPIPLSESDPIGDEFARLAKQDGKGGVIFVSTVSDTQGDDIGPHTHFWAMAMVEKCDDVSLTWDDNPPKGGEEMFRVLCGEQNGDAAT